MKKKRVAIVTTHPIQYQVPLFKKINNKNIKIDVFFASRYGLKSNKKDFELNIKFNWDIDLLSGYNSYFSKKQTYDINSWKLSFKNLENYLSKKNYEAILFFGWNNLLYLKTFFLAKKLKIPTILRVETNLKSKIGIFKKIVKFIVLKVFFKYIDFFMYIGKHNKDFYLKLGVPKKKLYSAPYFVDNNYFRKKSKKSFLFKKKYNFKGKKICLFVGKLIDRKNPIEFLNLALSLKENNKFHFLLVGNGELMNLCKDYIKQKKISNITILGFKNQSDLRKIYSIADVLVITSKYETWGLVINEAMASGVPVIANYQCGGAIDLIKNNITGFTYKNGNILELQKKFLKLINNDQLYKSIKKNIKNKINNFSIEKTTFSIQKILNEKNLKQ